MCWFCNSWTVMKMVISKIYLIDRQHYSLFFFPLYKINLIYVYNEIINFCYYFWIQIWNVCSLSGTARVSLCACNIFFESIMFLRGITHHIHPIYSLRRCVRLHPEATIADEKPLLSLQLHETRVCPSERNWVAADRPSADTSTNTELDVMRR